MFRNSLTEVEIFADEDHAVRTLTAKQLVNQHPLKEPLLAAASQLFDIHGIRLELVDNTRELSKFDGRVVFLASHHGLIFKAEHDQREFVVVRGAHELS